MSGMLFGYYDLGLRALSAAQLGLQVAGDNIANVSTPGFARRRMDLATGPAMLVPGGQIDRGVEVQRIRRVEDRFLQATLNRERGAMGYADERLRGVRQIESTFGRLDGANLSSAYSAFSDTFGQLAAQPEGLALRRSALGAAENLARQLRDTYGRLEAQRRNEDDAIGAEVATINRLAFELESLNRQIGQAEAGGVEAGGLRDRRQTLVEELVERTGGTAVAAENGRIHFSLPGGPTLVTAESALPLTLSRDGNGLLTIAGAGGVDLGGRLRSGKLGALLSVRDEAIGTRLDELDRLAADLITRANALTATGVDLDGNPGGPLFTPDPAPGTGAARSIAVSADLLADARRLALSSSGAPGDGSIAIDLSRLQHTASAALGSATPGEFLADALTSLGNTVVQADVASGVAHGLVQGLEARRESVSGVSLDEEAVDLIRYQRAYEAAARFIQVLNEISEIAVNLR